MALTLDDLAHHLNFEQVPAENTVERRELQRALDSALQEITRMTGLVGDRTISAPVRKVGRSLLLPYVRLASVGAVTDPSGYVVTPTDADPLTGVVDLGAAQWVGGTYTVTVTGAPWPAAVEHAALDWAGHLYDVQRATRQAVDDDEPMPTFALPNRVSELLAPYARAGIA